jgi:hypothetical protein
MKKKFLAFGLLFFVLSVSHALEIVTTQSPSHFLLGMGLSGGGDKLISTRYTNGDTVNIHAGGLIYFTAGVDYRVTPEFSLQATANYQVERANANNGNIKFERFPAELIGYYQPNPAWRVGGGVRYASGQKLSGSGVASGMDASFDNSTSTVVEGEYFVNPKLGIKLRYVHETIKSSGYGDIDGSHAGLSANFYF